MTRDEIRDAVRDALDEVLMDPMEEVLIKATSETTLFGDLGADSLDTMELAMEFEERFELSIEDAHVEQWKTFGDVVEYLAKRLGVPA